MIFITKGDTKGPIFEQFVLADALSKLVTVIETHLKTLSANNRVEQASNLAPMSRVLLMLITVLNERNDHKDTSKRVARAILEEYRDIPTDKSPNVAQVTGSAESILELLNVCNLQTFFYEKKNILKSYQYLMT